MVYGSDRASGSTHGTQQRNAIRSRHFWDCHARFDSHCDEIQQDETTQCNRSDCSVSWQLAAGCDGAAVFHAGLSRRAGCCECVRRRHNAKKARPALQAGR